MEFLLSFHRRHLAGKPVVVSPNVGWFLRLFNFYITGNFEMSGKKLISLQSVLQMTFVDLHDG